MAKKKKISFDIIVYDSLNELKESDKKLLDLAVEARKNAYAPYSRFNVGAAVLLENGEVEIGSNQENASYPSGLCAERVAIFHAGARFPGVPVKAIAITAASEDYEVTVPAAPCGNCRQAIFEYEFKQKSPIRLLLMGASGSIVECASLEDILPLGFNNTFLK
ncbi:cytidine deaminase [Maribacter sp. MMG018]|uniref:cytidine deaminase n=1 Tax=Maribacter sp. MMG018 TaxID=2822688 RepID=UPI001B38E489|nr:cytidine deaminase [Maribacter sp. MMG018]MBQ4915994.1 cytidine deaminase [Maribacter sp. MMG018]